MKYSCLVQMDLLFNNLDVFNFIIQGIKVSKNNIIQSKIMKFQIYNHLFLKIKQLGKGNLINIQICFSTPMSKTQHPYNDVNLKKQPQQYLYDQAEVHWGQIDHYTISEKLGRGKYAHLFSGHEKKHRKKVAIKVLLPIKPEKIKRQYVIHKMLNHPSIIKYLDIVRCQKQRQASFIFEYFEHEDFLTLYPKLTLQDTKIYMKQLLQGLQYIHSKGIMHRDIKPFNILINPEQKALKIIDFGLADFYFPEKQNNTHVASLYYKGPELFFSNASYDYRVDIWSAGLILAGMIFNRAPFLHGTDNIDQILKITKLVGTREVVKYIKEHKLTEKKGHKKENICFDLLIAFENGDIKQEKPSDLHEFINPGNESKASWQALDLIKKMLTLDYKHRLTAKQCLQHPFFDNMQ